MNLFLVGLFIWSMFCIRGQESNSKNMLLGIGLMLFGAIFVLDKDGGGMEYQITGYLFATLGLISLLLGASGSEKD